MIVESKEKSLVYTYERQKFTVSEQMDDGTTQTGTHLDKKEIDERLKAIREELGVPTNSNSNSKNWRKINEREKDYIIY